MTFEAFRASVGCFRVWIRVGSLFVKIDFDGFRASVELSFDAAPVSVTCSKSKIWPRTKKNVFRQI